jgi:hypothetical protein
LMTNLTFEYNSAVQGCVFLSGPFDTSHLLDSSVFRYNTAVAVLLPSFFSFSSHTV